MIMMILKAKEGMFLTQKSVRKEEWRIFCKEVYLSPNDSEENWVDAYADDKLEWEKAQEERNKEKEERYGKDAISE